MEYIYGKNAINAYLETNYIIEIYATKESVSNDILKKTKSKRINIVEKNKQYLDNLVQGAKHQGLVARIKDFNYSDYNLMVKRALEKQRPVILMLDGIEDPHNLGAIIRTCEAFQIDGIIIGKHNCCQVNSTVAKVSTGALAYVDIVQVTNLTQTLKDLKEKGFWIVAAEADNSTDYNKMDYNMPTVLIVGSEGYGISRLVKQQADYNVKIPMTGKVNSLNVSVATAILLSRIVNK